MRRVPWGTGARPEQKLRVPEDPMALLPDFRSRRAPVSAPRGKAIVLLYSTLTLRTVDRTRSGMFTLFSLLISHLSSFSPSQILLPSWLFVAHRQGMRRSGDRGRVRHNVLLSRGDRIGRQGGPRVLLGLRRRHDNAVLHV